MAKDNDRWVLVCDGSRVFKAVVSSFPENCNNYTYTVYEMPDDGSRQFIEELRSTHEECDIYEITPDNIAEIEARIESIQEEAQYSLSLLLNMRMEIEVAKSR